MNDTQNFPLTGPINVFVRIGRGSVRLETRDDLTEATVRITHQGESSDGFGDPPVAAVMRGPTLHVASPREGGVFDGFFGRGRTPGVEVELVVPTSTAVKITTLDAPITISGRVSGADIAFGRGHAEIDAVDGDLRLRFGQGTVHARTVGGSVEVRSGAGSVRIGDVGGDIRSGCGSGDLEVDVAHGAVRSRSGSGTTRLGEVHGDVDVTSGSGQLEIGLPGGQPARVDVHTASGRARSDLPVVEVPVAKEQAITVRARTGRGDVRLFRSPSAAA